MIEFLHKFYQDESMPFLWHYVHELDENSKPIPATDDIRARFIAPMNPTILEIGSGKGAFLCEYAKRFPDVNILGAEWDLHCANFTAKKIEKLKLKNAFVMRGDLFYFLRDVVQPNSIEEIHTYFPDPWPKRRQQKNRLILREGFLDLLCKALKNGKRNFYWATDHEEYNRLALEVFRNFERAKILIENTAEPTHGIETGFEKKYIKEGRKIYRSIIEFSI